MTEAEGMQIGPDSPAPFSSLIAFLFLLCARAPPCSNLGRGKNRFLSNIYDSKARPGEQADGFLF